MRCEDVDAVRDAVMGMPGIVNLTIEGLNDSTKNMIVRLSTAGIWINRMRVLVNPDDAVDPALSKSLADAVFWNGLAPTRVYFFTEYRDGEVDGGRRDWAKRTDAQITSAHENGLAFDSYAAFCGTEHAARVAPVKRFLRRDGDHAISWRVRSFLVVIDW